MKEVEFSRILENLRKDLSPDSKNLLDPASIKRVIISKTKMIAIYINHQGEHKEINYYGLSDCSVVYLKDHELQTLLKFNEYLIKEGLIKKEFTVWKLHKFDKHFQMISLQVNMLLHKWYKVFPYSPECLNMIHEYLKPSCKENCCLGAFHLAYEMGLIPHVPHIPPEHASPGVEIENELKEIVKNAAS